MKENSCSIAVWSRTAESLQVLFRLRLMIQELKTGRRMSFWSCWHVYAFNLVQPVFTQRHETRGSFSPEQQPNLQQLQAAGLRITDHIWMFSDLQTVRPVLFRSSFMEAWDIISLLLCGFGWPTSATWCFCLLSLLWFCFMICIYLMFHMLFGLLLFLSGFSHIIWSNNFYCHSYLLPCWKHQRGCSRNLSTSIKNN